MLTESVQTLGRQAFLLIIVSAREKAGGVLNPHVLLVGKSITGAGRNESARHGSQLGTKGMAATGVGEDERASHTIPRDLAVLAPVPPGLLRR